MTVYVGKTNWWWRDSPNAPVNCKVKATVRLDGAAAAGKVLNDGSTIICVGGGAAWIVAPSSTQVGSQWAGGQYNSTQVGDKCCISEWPALEAALTNAGFNPTDWFVPSYSQINNPGFVCRSKWDSYAEAIYWSSTESDATCATCVHFGYGNPYCCAAKFCGWQVRAFRCVTY